jgi:hypothetical protein
MNKKLSFITLLAISSFMSTLVFAGAPKTRNPHDVGRDRAFTIMYDGDHGISNYNKNITYAETQNLIEDVAIPQAALYFEPKTDFGQTYLIDTLSFPVSPKDTNDTINRRQANIQKLQNPAIQQEFTPLLLQAKDAQGAIMELMTNRDSALESSKLQDLSYWGALETVVKPWYIMEKYYNDLGAKNAWWNLSQQVTRATAAFAMAGASVASAKLAYEETTKPDFKFANPEKEEKFAQILGKHPSQATTWTQAASEKYKNLIDLGIMNPNSNYIPNINSDELNRTLGYTAGSIYAGFTALDSTLLLNADYQKGLKNRNLIHGLHTFVVVAEKIEALCKKHGLETQFTLTSIKDPQGLAMIQGLKHPRYQGKESSLVATPWVNTFVNEIYAQDIYLAPIFALIAEMDAYHAIATKMTAIKNLPNKFCFAQVLNQTKPKFDAQGFWNVVVSNPVANSLSEDRNIILTGPNAGGKSTAIRSILQNIVLSQTFGIATGELFASTPYDVIHSYLKVTDDINHGLSRYASELKRASDTINRIKTLRHDEKFFFVLDELFTGTGGKDGELAAYEYVNDDLAPFTNQIQFIFATHFDKLKEIENNNPARFANYKIDVPITNAQGKLQFPFTLSKGINNINIAMQMKREAGLLGKTTGLLNQLQAA